MTPDPVSGGPAPREAEIRNEVRKLLARMGADFPASMAGAHAAVDALRAVASPSGGPAPREPCAMHARCLGCERVIYGSVPDSTCAKRADCALTAYRRAVASPSVGRDSAKLTAEDALRRILAACESTGRTNKPRASINAEWAANICGAALAEIDRLRAMASPSRGTPSPEERQRIQLAAGQEAKRQADDVGLTENHAASFHGGFLSGVSWTLEEKGAWRMALAEAADSLRRWAYDAAADHLQAVALAGLRGTGQAPSEADDWWRRYLRHDDGCAVGPGSECSCGLTKAQVRAAALAALPQPEADVDALLLEIETTARTAYAECHMRPKSDGFRDFQKIVNLVRRYRGRAASGSGTGERDVTCECGRGPRETVEHDDGAGVKSWRLANLCTDCLEEQSVTVRRTALAPQEDEGRSYGQRYYAPGEDTDG